MTEARPEKPPYGSPCNHCGRCCEKELCPLAADLYKRWLGPCPALEIRDGRSHCGLAERPERYFPLKAAIAGSEELKSATSTLIGSGVGCDAQTETEIVFDAARKEMHAKYARYPWNAYKAAERAWRVRLDG